MIPSFANPSMAWDLEAAPGAPAYIDHATASLDAVSSEADQAETPKILSEDVHFSTPVATHAVSAVPAEAPFESDAPASKLRSLASLVEEYDEAGLGGSDMECLAGAIYFESKGEPLAGQLAVAEVIINRSKSGRYPSTLCGVVKQPSQFSFVRGGRMPAIDKSSAHWRKAVAIAHIAVNDLADSPAENALSFHASYVSPGWRMKRVARVGNHIFYR